MRSYKDSIMEKYSRIAQRYKKWKNEGKDYMIDDKTVKMVAEGGYISNTGDLNNIKEGSKPYYEYLKYGNKLQQEEPIMIENNYETPYLFEYEPYLLDNSNNNYSITFDHEVDTSDSIQIIEELYNEEPVEEVEVDSNEIIDVLSFLTNKISNIKKHIIHYISNYRPIYNQYTGDIDTILIE